VFPFFLYQFLPFLLSLVLPLYVFPFFLYQFLSFLLSLVRPLSLLPVSVLQRSLKVAVQE
jgi:hypothetical protein